MPEAAVASTNRATSELPGVATDGRGGLSTTADTALQPAASTAAPPDEARVSGADPDAHPLSARATTTAIDEPLIAPASLRTLLSSCAARPGGEPRDPSQGLEDYGSVRVAAAVPAAPVVPATPPEPPAPPPPPVPAVPNVAVADVPSTL